MEDNNTLGMSDQNWGRPSNGEITAPPVAVVGLFVIGKYQKFFEIVMLREFFRIQFF